MYVVLVYDISGEANGQKVLGKVFKTCKKYLTHIQNSVFEGEITGGQIVKLNAELNKLIRKDLDSMIIFNKPVYISKNEVIQASSFPLDYDFNNNKPHYICGMSVPPLMIANIASEVYKQWLTKIK